MHVSPGARETSPGGLSSDEDGAAVANLERLERYLRDEGFQVSTAIRTGEPAREIVEFGGSIQADCIIMGRHDHAGITTPAKSATTSYVEQQAACTVVAVP
jgi:nucleotide-binding universal stress UspA family protein